MANKGVKQSTRGNLNKDVDPKAMRNGDYEDALDVLHINKGSNKSLNAEPTLGNKYAFTIEPRVAQNKRIRFNIPTQANYEATVFKTDGVTPLFSFFFSNPTDFTVNFAVGAGAAGLQINFVETTSTFVTVEILTPAYYDWFVSSVGSVEFTFDVLQEALSPNYIGIPKIIGSVDLLGNLFVFSTTKTQEQRDFTITDIYNSGGRIGITTSEPHGLQNGFEVNISGTQIDRYADGLWIVQVINASSFILQLSDASTLNLSVPITGTVSVYVRGYGEIGVAVKDLNTDSWQYTRLLGSKEFNFDTFHLIECRAEANNLGNSLYFHQVLRNVPKVFYYNQETFIQDGGLSINGGQYEYGRIVQETEILAYKNIPIPKFLKQEIGGTVTSGNKRYVIRLSNDFIKSPWSAPTGLVNIYQSNINNPSQIEGGISGEITDKRVFLEVNAIDLALYKYIELGVIEYISGAINSYNLYRVPVTSDTMTLIHSGSENSKTDLPLDEFFSTNTPILNVGNEAILDNRLVYGNITVSDNLDLSEFAQTVKYRLKQKDIGATSLRSYSSFVFGGYQNPLNTCNYMGYFYNDEYRFGISAILNDGTETQVFHTFDVRFDTSPTSTDGKRLQGLPNYDNVRQVNDEFVSVIPYIEFVFDTNYTFNGTPIKNLIKRIKVYRCKRIPEVLACGVLCNVVEQTKSGTSSATEPGKPLIPWLFMNQVRKIVGSSIRTVEVYENYALITDASGNTSIDPNPDFNFYNYPESQFEGSNTSHPIEPNKYLRAGLFFSPDCEYSNINEDFIKGSKLRVFFSPNFAVCNQKGVNFDPIRSAMCEEFFLNQQVYEDYEITASNYITRAGEHTFSLLNKTLKKTLDSYYFPEDRTFTFEVEKSYAFAFEKDIPSPKKGLSQRYYYAQIIRNIEDKYGLISNSNYEYCVSFADVDTNSSLIQLETFGGDAFSGKIWQRFSYIKNDANNDKWGTSLAYHGQTVVNYDMRYYIDDSSGSTFPISNSDYQNWLSNYDSDQYNYDLGYNYQNGLFVLKNFDSNLIYFKRYKTRIIYSLLKPQNSILDLYRIFPFNQYYDLDPQYGEITHIEVLNNELYAWQERKVNRMFFNTTGVLTTVEGDISVLGNQGVISRKPIALSAFGTKHKFSVVKGTSAGGQDVAYWINSESNMLMRFGADGSVAISILWGLMGFLNDNLKWAQQNLKYTGNRYGYGIYGVWDERFKEAIFTVRAAKDVDDWQIRQSYTANRSNFSVVRNYNQLQFSTFEESPDIFICTQDHTATADTEPGVGVNWQSYWVVAPHTDNNYYNEYTIALNEIKNGFSTFYTHKPAIYMRYRNKFLTAHPKMKYSNVSFEHREGEYLTWYNYEGEEQTSTGYIMPIINIDPEAIKWYLAVWMVTKFAPFRMEFYTDKHESYLDAEDFEEREGVWISNIKNDLDNITQRNDLDTSQLYGSYLKVKIFFEPKKFQQFFDFVTLLRLSQRSYVK